MLTAALRAVFAVNLAVMEDERVLVFTDRISQAEKVHEDDLCRRERLRDLALLFAETGKAFSRKVRYAEFQATGTHGAEPPEEAWAAAFGDKTAAELRDSGLMGPLLAKKASEQEIAAAEAIIRRRRNSVARAVIALSNYSTSHTRFRAFLTDFCGCRYASMPLFDVDMLEGAMNVDCKTLARRTESVVKALNKADDIELTTPNGTELKLSKKDRTALPDTGLLTKPGDFGNLPAGEAFVAPLEGTAEGRLVLEWAPSRELASPVVLQIKAGRVTKVGGKEPFAAVLRNKILERGENGNIAELGIGTNDRARRPCNILEAEKILGTVHIALGDNSSFGGTVRTPFHQDFVFFKPTLVLKREGGSPVTLLDNGRLLVK